MSALSSCAFDNPLDANIRPLIHLLSVMQVINVTTKKLFYVPALALQLGPPVYNRFPS